MTATSSESTGTTVRETERKYESRQQIDPSVATTLVEGVIGEAGLTSPAEPTEVRLSATYFDTPDLRLLRGGVTLRCRRGGHDDGWHLKVPVGGDDRNELREPLGDGDEPPPRLVGATTALRRGARLGPVVELVTDRCEWLLADADGRPVASMTHDRVTSHTMGEATATASWSEVEVELDQHGTPGLLDEIEVALAGAGLHRSSWPSKVGRALAERSPSVAPRPVARRKATAGEAVLAYLWEQFDAMRAHDPMVREGSGQALHKMRVASRRMRSALQAFRTVIAREHTDPVVAELRWLAGELGGARDLDVQEERITSAIAKLPVELSLGPVVADTERWFGQGRADAEARMRAALDSQRYVTLLDSVEALLTDPPLLEPAHHRARTVLPARIARVLRRTETALAVARDRDPGPARDEAIHEMRKSAKRLRYAAELSAPVVGKSAERLVESVKDLQELLGEHQDSVVARPLLRQLGAAGNVQGRNGFTFGWLARDELARAERVEGELDDAWAHVRKSAKRMAKAASS